MAVLRPSHVALQTQQTPDTLMRLGAPSEVREPPKGYRSRHLRSMTLGTPSFEVIDDKEPQRLGILRDGKKEPIDKGCLWPSCLMTRRSPFPSNITHTVRSYQWDPSYHLGGDGSLTIRPSDDGVPNLLGFPNVINFRRRSP